MENEYYWDDPVEAEASSLSSRRRTFRVLAMAVAIASIFSVVRATMAANVSLGSGAIEFGQGVSVQAACAGNTVLTLTPGTSFQNSAGSGDFKIASISISNIPAGCNNKDFKIKVYDSATATGLPIYDTSTSELWIHADGSTYRGISPGDGYSVTSTSGKFVATFNFPASSTSAAKTFTLESSEFKPNYKVGDIGPGGGLVFYYNPTGIVVNGHFIHYMEMAPKTWNGGSLDPQLPWAVVGNQSSAVTTSTTMGSGYANTVAIVNQGNGITTAAGAVRAYSANGKSDWFLPSDVEAEQVCKFLYAEAWVNDSLACAGTGTLNTNVPANYQYSSTAYWLSTQYSATLANEFYMSLTNVVSMSKANSYYVRPIRAFYN